MVSNTIGTRIGLVSGWRGNADKYLSYVLAVYVFLLMFVGRFEATQKIVVWMAGPLFAIIVFSNYVKHYFKLPTEVILYGLLWLWTFPGFVKVIDVGGYFRYFRLVFTILVFFFCIQVVVIRTGRIELIYKVLILVSLLISLHGLFVGQYFSNAADVDNPELTRLHGLVQNANGFSSVAIMGIGGVLFLWRSIKTLNGKIFSIIILSYLIFTVILTASRSGFISMLTLFVCWLVFCYYKNFVKHKFVYIFLILVFVPVLNFGYSYLLEETYLGERFQNVEDRELTEETRFQLYMEGFEMFKQSPLYGVGLSQFPVYSSRQAIAHSEYMELLATTGLGGFLLMISFYYVILRKNYKVKKVIGDKDVLYRVNMGSAIIVSVIVFGIFRANFLDIVPMLQMAMVACYSNYLIHKYKAYQYLQSYSENQSK
ncbi:MAG: O-antigen ligase family protein [Ignavibacteriae bacterium]|nr:O-antigen ligase family protein [Ignavibacteriota bacterium]